MPLTLSGDTGVPATAMPFLVGQVCHFAMNSAPPGFLKANGQAISRTVYARLFAVIGTTYGAGDGSTTFNVPDLRGEFVRSLDDGRGVDPSRSIGSAQADAMQGHWHDPDLSLGNSAASGGSASGWQIGSSTTMNYSRVRQPITDGVNGAPRTAAENRPRNVAMLACIFTGV